MNWTPQLQAFVTAHIDDDTTRLLLSASRWPDVDVRAAVAQIEVRRRLRDKLPEWMALPAVVAGSRLSAEQCSSQQTACYKRSLVVGTSLVDLTGGMGVDCWYMSRGLADATYVERDTALADVARHNFAALTAATASSPEVRIVNGDGTAWLDHIRRPETTTLYLDPARRAADGRRVYDLTQCEPDVVAIQDKLRAACARLVVKVSPMADVTRMLAAVGHIEEIHVVGVRGECKEVLLVVGGAAGTAGDAADVSVRCIDFTTTATLRFDFDWDGEPTARVTWADGMGRYLYEPDVTVMKAGAFRTVGERYGIAKLDTSTHLYTSDSLVEGFAGKVFAVEGVDDASSSTLKSLGRTIAAADITVRNFPMTVDRLRRRTGIREGGDGLHLFATTVRGLGAVVVRCRRLLALVALMTTAVTAGMARSEDVPTLAEVLAGVVETPPTAWESGRQFAYLDSTVHVALVPEAGTSTPTPPPDVRGTVWTFLDIVGEENWLGQTTVALRFRAPWGSVYRYDAGSSLAAVAHDEAPSDTPTGQNDRRTLHVAGLYPLDIIQAVDSCLRTHMLYIAIDDERIVPLDSTTAAAALRKFVPIVVDSVSPGSDAAPLRVCYSRPSADSATLYYAVFTCLPADRSAATATPIDRYFVTADPRLAHPDIDDRTWNDICSRRVRPDMMADEVRLSMGRPQDVQRLATRGGIVERWAYRSGLVVELIDGRVRAVGVAP